MVGIISYGAYIPDGRIKKDTHTKSVANLDEDSCTQAVMASLYALNNANIPAQKLEAIYVGSETHPYDVKPTSTMVASSLGVGNNYLAADVEFACKAGTASLQIIQAFIHAKQIRLGLAVGTDIATAKDDDALSQFTSAAAASFIVGDDPKCIIASLDDTLSYSSDTPDFFRRAGNKYPSHMGRFTGEPSYFKHILEAATHILQKNNLDISAIDHVVFHMPNIKFPRRIAKRLGVTDAQLKQGFIVPSIGNAYSATSLIGLANVLDNAQPDQKILLVSYGSGAGSDAFLFTTQPCITSFHNTKPVQTFLKNNYQIHSDQLL